MVKDIYPGYNGSYPFSLYNFKNKLYFAADYGYGPFLWTSDGSEAGTKVVKPALIQYYQPFADANNKLFFDAYSTVANGYELYATDGTTPGTKLVRDINSGPASSNPFNLTKGNALLYFLADDGKHGMELWVSNGVKAGTHLVKNITPGTGSSYLNYMVNVQDKLFFTMNDSLWQSDATNSGTHKISDPALNGTSNFSGLTAIGDWLYFSAYNNATGQEVFTAKATALSAPPNFILQNAPSSIANNDVFEVKLLTNPVTNHLKLMVTVAASKTAQIVITDASGRMMQTASRTLQAGTTVMSFDAGSWAHGIYVIKVSTADGKSATLKALK